MVITYTAGTNPEERGVYACRVPHEFGEGLHQDVFLMWMDGQWSYLGSDQQYRGEVTGWIGPLQRRMQVAATTAPAPARTEEKAAAFDLILTKTLEVRSGSAATIVKYDRWGGETHEAKVIIEQTADHRDQTSCALVAIHKAAAASTGT